MTTYEQLSVLISIVGFAAVVISLWFLYRQTKIASFGTVHNFILSCDRIFVEYPHMRPYFYDGKDIQEGEVDYNLALAIAETILDTFEAYVHQGTYVEYYETMWERYIRDAFRDSPVLRRYFDRVRGWYPEKIGELRDRAG